MDLGYKCYAAINNKYTIRLEIKKIFLPYARQLGTAVGRAQPTIRKLVKCKININK